VLIRPLITLWRGVIDVGRGCLKSTAPSLLAEGSWRQVPAGAYSTQKTSLASSEQPGSPVPHGWAEAAVRVRRETSACPTRCWPASCLIPACTLVILTHSWLLHPRRRWGCGAEGHPSRTTAACSFKGNPKEGAGVHVWQPATATRVPFALPLCASPVSPSFYCSFLKYL